MHFYNKKCNEVKNIKSIYKSRKIKKLILKTKYNSKVVNNQVKILVHYTTQQSVFDSFNESEYIIEKGKYSKRFDQIDKYYKRNHVSQDNLFFVIQFYDSIDSNKKFLVGKIIQLDDDIYKYSKVSDEIYHLILKDLGLESINSYHKDIYYKEYYIEDKEDFYTREINEFSEKIKLKYFSWDELLSNNKILHKKLIDILFDRENVINIASTYNVSSFSLIEKEKILEKKYISILKNIGFITDKEIDIDNTILHGDIGEFLMNTMVTKFLDPYDKERFIFPKLAFKTNPNSPVHGYDGTLYNKSRKEIYYTESKLYSTLSEALREAVNSMNLHNKTDYAFIESHMNSFRNIASSKTDEIIMIPDDVHEKLIIFLMCEDKYSIDDISMTINRSRNLKDLQKFNEIIIFVLPILNKQNFLSLFKEISKKKGEYPK